ncbi:hypothetical protein CHS0354_021988 [Potamilus streckersoni]|uniref:Glutaredoxin domain-containing protein n=1 Tax=Potamilus streckersoni TaxID=2493646 RepID=A0AAE0SL52_9BIVA|nr:hypothetical protein CHS0354_021988 [Potamilus streckersoni]
MSCIEWILITRTTTPAYDEEIGPRPVSRAPFLMFLDLSFEMAGAGAQPFVDNKLKQRKVLLFSKTSSPECKTVKELLQEYKMAVQHFEVVEIEKRQDVNQIEDYFMILCLSDRREVPQLFVDGKYVGGEKEILLMHESGQLKKVLQAAGVM